MKDVIAVLQKEWRGFAGSEKGVFMVFGILVLSWSLLSRNNASGTSDFFSSVWWLFFSVVVCSNFANTVFVTERVNGSMEILLTSGFSRSAVLAGKVLFVIVVSVVIGGLCAALSLLWICCFDGAAPLLMRRILDGTILFTCGAFMNAAAGAWMSIRFSSFRIIPFVNMLILSVMCAVYYTLTAAAGCPDWLLMAILTASGILFLILAAKDFNGEKIITPVDL